MIQRLPPPTQKSDKEETGPTEGESWTTRLRVLTDAGRHGEALALLRRMFRHPNPPPDASTLPAALLAAAALSLPSAAAQLHSRAISSGSLAHPFVLTALLSSYSRLSLLPLSRRLFADVSPSAPAATLVVAFNALISGHARHSLPSGALALFRGMRRSALPFNAVTLLALLPSCAHSAVPPLHACAIRVALTGEPSVANCLLSAYARAGAVDLARQMFDEMPNPKQLISWNAMISGYAQNGLAPRVLDLYREMEQSGEVEPDPVTLVGVLASCAHLGADSVGRRIERYIAQNPAHGSNIYLKNALINLHARCGDLARAREIFDMMQKRSIFSWTAMIAGYGMHGHGVAALQLFERMRASGIRPDGVVMVSVLSACSHAGMTEEGLEYFSKMERLFGVVPGPEHYACMVDLLGRAGRLEQASDLIKSMPVEPDGAVWGALLGACKIHKNVELGELAFKHVVKLEPMNVGYYVLLSNVYSDAGRLDGVARIRSMMRRRGLRKDAGCSYMELEGSVHLFVADDHSHPQARRIYEMVVKLEALAKEACGVESKKDELRNEKGKILPVTGFHSEKLAVAFGLLNTEAGTEIVVIKNLRVCEDCHLFMKVVSNIANRKFVVRDASRFHHFEGGVCSCKDYW
ncbi:putative pentatricopeptide repeat-containing protein At3g11460, mitochondrial [Phoenix dactylifera]|uniref:Pentatricopeptide repeat-containing protein At3g11460, mitochondrial n=1 Tax=Phoenix dactylifera TaxID=42345 RepID=A0A8B7BZG4_PHODC|nr:putative pentatricopeptide repeat-containing protein At3g11460, mitochondrial [Phoenix dactylifera]